MTEGFSNPIIGGGGGLVYPSIHSPNFSAGPPITGWSIDKNGDAFFSGVVGGVNFEITSAGAFFYSGTPALGNLIFSIASTAGTDQYGNAYKNIAVAYGSSGTAVAMFSDELFLFTGSADELAAASLQPTVQAGPPVILGLDILGPQMTGAGLNDKALVALFSAASDGSLPAKGWLYWVNTSGLAQACMQWGPTGIQAIAASVTGQEPGVTSTPTAETWHNMALSAGFAAGSPTPQYRFEPVGAAGQVRLRGVATTAGAVAGGASICPLPAGYHPAKLQQLTCPLAGYTYAAGQAACQVTTGGVIETAVAAPGVSEIIFDGVTFPLD